MSDSIVPGSLGAIAQKDGSLAEAFMSADIVVIVDVSGSMSGHDSRGGRSRYDVACDELAKLQANNPGRIAVVCFSSHTQFCPGGIPEFLGGSTDLAAALQFVKVADGCVQFIVISDGQPDSEREALDVARTFTSQIDCIFVGPESDWNAIGFLERLAQMSHGRYATAEKAAELAATVQQFMLKAG
jgi:hypothetical protein